MLREQELHLYEATSLWSEPVSAKVCSWSASNRHQQTTGLATCTAIAVFK